MIPLLALQSFTRVRRGATSVDADFNTTAGTDVSAVLQGSVQSNPDSAREWLPDGMMGRNTLEVISYSEVRGPSQANGELADRIVFGGTTYEVFQSTHQPAWLNPEHWEVLCIEAQPIKGQ